MFMITDKIYQRWGDETGLVHVIADNLAKGSLKARDSNYPECKKIVV